MVMNVSEIQGKVMEATNDDAWYVVLSCRGIDSC
jgi:hypothetical protein